MPPTMAAEDVAPLTLEKMRGCYAFDNALLSIGQLPSAVHEDRPKELVSDCQEADVDGGHRPTVAISRAA